MAVLVTGIGYIGSQLVTELLAAGYEVVGLENFFSTPRSSLEPLARQLRFSLVEGSVASARCVRQAFERARPVQAVFHLAAQASADPTAAPVRVTEATNLVGTRQVVEAAVAYGAPLVVFGSSFWVYGRQPRGVISENSAYGPQADLSHLSKIYAEKLLEMYSYRCGLCTAAVRLGVVHGVAPVMKTDTRFMTVPNKFCLQAVRRHEIAVHENAGFAPFVHVRDAASAMLIALQLPERRAYDVFNAASEVLSVEEVAQVVREEASRNGVVAAVRAGGQARGVPWSFTSRLRALGWTPQVRMPESIRELLAYFRGSGAGLSSAP